MYHVELHGVNGLQDIVVPNKRATMETSGGVQLPSFLNGIRMSMLNTSF